MASKKTTSVAVQFCEMKLASTNKSIRLERIFFWSGLVAAVLLVLGTTATALTSALVDGFWTKSAAAGGQAMVAAIAGVKSSASYKGLRDLWAQQDLWLARIKLLGTPQADAMVAAILEMLTKGKVQ